MAPPSALLPSVIVTVFGMGWVRVWVLRANSEATNLGEVLDSTGELFWRACSSKRVRRGSSVMWDLKKYDLTRPSLLPLR